MTALNMAKHRNNPNFAFWKMLKEGYDHFNATHQEPKVAVCDRRYVYDAVAPNDSGRALSFNATGACPAYQLDKNVADAVLDVRRQEQYKMAEYITNGVSTVPSRAGLDGGMNPVFVAKLTPQSGFDNNGRTYQVASMPGTLPRAAEAPGALPRDTAPPAAAAEAPAKREPATTASKPVAVANVPVPRSAPQAKQGEAPEMEQKPTTIAGLIGSWFSGSKETSASPPEKEQAAVRGANTDLAAKPKQVAPVRPTAPATTVSTASTVAPASKPRDPAPNRPRLPCARPRRPHRCRPRKRSRRSNRNCVPRIPHRRRAIMGCSPALSRSSRLAPSAASGNRIRQRQGARNMDCYVYVIGTLTNTRHLTYVGWTDNVTRRVAVHNAGKARAQRAVVHGCCFIRNAAQASATL